MYKILDVSSYQPDIDYKKVAKNVDGVVLRCGVTYWGKQTPAEDKCFDKHYEGFKTAGVPVGAYYYSAADSVEKAQEEAAFTLSLLDGKQFELPIYFDCECEERMGKLSRAALTEICTVYCDTLEKAGYFVGIYANTNYFRNRLEYAQLAKRFTLWLADYRGDNADKLLCRDVWQYTDSGKVPGINGNVDLNECYRGFTAEIKKAGLNGFKKAEKKPIAKIVEEILAGEWGNGEQRKNRLIASGYDYDEVQDAVNDEIITICAKAVIRGLYGNGVERTIRLKKAGYDPEKVQQRVNELLAKGEN